MLFLDEEFGDGLGGKGPVGARQLGAQLGHEPVG
jgi:hypothetical protein